MYIEWESVACSGDDIEGHSYKPMTKIECKAKCNLLPNCTFAVHGGSYGQTGSRYGWWADRCVLRNNMRKSCWDWKIEGLQREWYTYIKEGKYYQQLLITNIFISILRL